MSSSTPLKVPFRLATLIDDPGLILPKYSNLTEKEQEVIRRAIQAGKHQGQHPAWFQKPELERFTHCLSGLFKACAFNRNKWKRVELLAYWNHVVKSSKWPHDVVSANTIRTLVLTLLAARLDYKKGQAQPPAADDSQHEISSAIDRFYDQLSMKLGDNFLPTLEEMLSEVPQYPDEEEKGNKSENGEPEEEEEEEGEEMEGGAGEEEEEEN